LEIQWPKITIPHFLTQYVSFFALFLVSSSRPQIAPWKHRQQTWSMCFLGSEYSFEHLVHSKTERLAPIRQFQTKCGNVKVNKNSKNNINDGITLEADWDWRGAAKVVSYHR